MSLTVSQLIGLPNLLAKLVKETKAEDRTRGNELAMCVQSGLFDHLQIGKCQIKTFHRNSFSHPLRKRGRSTISAVSRLICPSAFPRSWPSHSFRPHCICPAHGGQQLSFFRTFVSRAPLGTSMASAYAAGKGKRGLLVVSCWLLVGGAFESGIYDLRLRRRRQMERQESRVNAELRTPSPRCA